MWYDLICYKYSVVMYGGISNFEIDSFLKFSCNLRISYVDTPFPYMCPNWFRAPEFWKKNVFTIKMHRNY